MGRKRTVLWGCAIVLLLLVQACSDDAGSNTPPPATGGRGSAACNEWQGAFCGFLSRCRATSPTCDQIKTIACKSDDEARRCAGVLNGQTCTAPQQACDVGGMVDPAPAQKACEDYENAACAFNEQCQPGSRDACLAKLKVDLPCAKAVGVGLTFEQCLVDFPKLDCSATSIPQTCNKVILVSQ